MKIEKFWLGIDPSEKTYQASIIENKLNEIIDAVNELQGEEKPEDFTLEELEQELDKAREEGYAKGLGDAHKQF